MNYDTIATSIVSILAPFTPFLVEAGKEGAKKLAEKLGELGGEAAWTKAQVMWQKLMNYFKNDKKLKGAALMISADPDDKSVQKIFADLLTVRLKNNPELAQDLLKLLEEETTIQEVIADQKSRIVDVTQESKGGGIQSISAHHGSQIKGVKQIKK